MEDDPLTEPQPGGAPSDDQRPTADQVIEENKRLRSKLANAEENSRRANAVVKVSQAIYAAPGGKEIFERAKAAMDSGNELRFSEKQEAKLEKTAEAVGLTAEQVQQIVAQGLEQHREQTSIHTKSERAMNDLHQRGIKELEGYEGMYQTEAFNRMISHTLDALSPKEGADGQRIEPALPLPEGESAYWYAIKHAHKMLTVGAKTPAGSKTTEQNRRAAIAGQQTVPAGGPEENSEEDSPDMAWAKAPISTTIGKSFS